MKKVLVIVDMVNGFVNEGALADKRINNITPNIIKLIESGQFRAIFAFRDCHNKDDEEFKTFPPHCLKGTRERELIPELKKYEQFFKDMPKQTTNGFKSENFKKFWKKHSGEEIEFAVTGCCTDICVRDFSQSLVKDIKQKQSPARVVVLEDCVSTFDSPSHNAQLVGDVAIQEMADMGIEISNCEKYLSEILSEYEQN